MALPASGVLSLNDIRVELGLASTNVSLRNMSASASFTSPDAISEFYGYASRNMTLSRTNCWFNDMGVPCFAGDDEFTVTSTHAWYSETLPNGAAVSPQSGNAGVTYCIANWGGTGGGTQIEYYYWTSDDALTGDQFTVINLDVGEACI